MKKTILTLMIVIITISLFGTNIDGKLLSLSKDNAKGFLKPLSSLYYYNLNAGNSSHRFGCSGSLPRFENRGFF